MNSITIFSIQILFILHRTYSHKNYRTVNQNPMKVNGYYDQGEIDYDYGSMLRSRHGHSKHHKKKCKNSDGILTIIYDEEYDTGSESEEYTCDCTQCTDIKPGCEDECANCYPDSQTSAHLISSQASVIYVPYPYALVPGMGMGLAMGPPLLPHAIEYRHINKTMNETTIAITRQKETATKDPPLNEPPDNQDPGRAGQLPEIGDMYLGEPKDKNRDDSYIITSFRPTKPYWLPKYGIVPLPDHVADRLMAKMRNTEILKKLKHNSE